MGPSVAPPGTAGRPTPLTGPSARPGRHRRRGDRGLGV